MSYDPEQITFFAKTDARGSQVPFGIKAKDRTRHVYVIGKTGMGKSTLLENMAAQDMQNGNGMCFIDPHGATAETLLNYVPEHRKDDVVYFAPFDTEHPIAFNVMEDVGPERRHLVAAGLMSVFKKIWVDAWSARMEYILQNTILALLEYPDSTLLGVNRMLSEKHYRKKVIDNISDPAVKSFWVDEFLNYNERYMQEAGDSIKNKIGQFTANPLIRNIIGQPKTSFDLRTIMDEKKILIANLSKGLVGEGNANLLGSMLTTRVYLAAMSRADLSPQVMKTMPNFYFYVDEFQSFANATFADILSEARKYHLNLTIAHQYVEQMEEEVKNAVFGNVGTMISFRVGPFDAETLETIFAPQFYAVDICNLGFAQIYLSLMIDGIGSRPFSAVTLPPIEPPEVSFRDVVICRSQENFAEPRAKIEGEINAWMAEDHAPAKPDRPNGGGNGNGNGGASNGGSPKPANGNGKNGHGNGGNGNNGNGRSKPPAADLEALRSVLKNLSAEQSPGAKPNNATDRGAVKKADRPSERSTERAKLESVPATAAPTPKAAAVAKPVSTKPDQAEMTESMQAKKNDLQAVLNNLTKRETVAKPTPKTETPKKPTSKHESQKTATTGSKTQATASTEAVADLQQKLRAVVEKQSRSETNVRNTPKKPTAEKPASKPAQPPASLRDALQSALKTSETTAESKPTPTPSASVTKSQPATDQVAPAPITPETKTYQEVKSVDTPNTLDPKKLERMMRVTTADHSPFKK